ncbi:uncharacterized protein LOC115805589 [Chanos chanos]|uniref:Uncharacterized protein LOC115805589 n=1 Tax=Chanos chanos TaxID=29144 RepID=A0A6J2UQC9_CHACN|nr:uncharacterized protein LOC115805589 [Chanos chanos]
MKSGMFALNKLLFSCGVTGMCSALLPTRLQADAQENNRPADFSGYCAASNAATAHQLIETKPFCNIHFLISHVHKWHVEFTMALNMQQYNSSALANGTYGPDWSTDVLVPSVILGLCFALGVPGNVTVLAVLIQRLKGDNFTFRLMLSLAVSDLLTLPVWICALLWGWILGPGLCKFLSYLIYWSLYSSVMNVTLLSAQRYVQVLYPNRWSKLGNPVRLALLLSTWVVGGVSAAPALVHRQNAWCPRWSWVSAPWWVSTAVVAAIGRGFKRESFTLTLMLSLAVCDLLSLLLVPLRTGIGTGTDTAAVEKGIRLSGRWAMQGGVLALECCIASPSISVRTVKNDPYQRCTVDYRSVLVEAFVLLGQTTLGFVVPFSTLACFYLCLHKRVRRSPFWNSPWMTKLLTGIVTSFFVFWVPLHFCNLLSLVYIAEGWHDMKKIICDNNWD